MSAGADAQFDAPGRFTEPAVQFGDLRQHAARPRRAVFEGPALDEESAWDDQRSHVDVCVAQQVARQ